VDDDDAVVPRGSQIGQSWIVAAFGTRPDDGRSDVRSVQFLRSAACDDIADSATLTQVQSRSSEFTAGTAHACTPAVPDSRPPRLPDAVRQAIRARHLSPRTEEAYVHWIRRFIVHHGKRHPRELGAAEVKAFLTDLAVAQRMSASTSNQALSALLFLYRHVVVKDLGRLEDLPRGRPPDRLPWCSHAMR
jgi:hypothetical protein